MKLGVILVFSIITIMIVPAYGDVISIDLEKSSYKTTEKFAFIGKEENGTKPIFVTIRNPSGGFVGMLADPISDADGNFLTILRPVEDFFTSQGIYNATAFSEDQNEKDGLTIRIQYDGTKIFLLPDFVLNLNTIPLKKVEEKKTLIFTASLSDPKLTDVVFSLVSPPAGTSINSETGKFTWTPTESQAGGQYLFDIVVKKGGIEDRQTVIIEVLNAPTPVSEEPEPPVPEEPEPKETGIAPFVDPKQDPQYYVDRYNNEQNYKNWFDKNYPDLTIYEAVGLENPEPPKELAPFVDPKQDPQYYVDRYNNEPNYKNWFDKNYAEYSSIYEAVGLEEPVIKEPEFGECGIGTKLIDGVCEVVETSSGGGGCLIATAAYGSEMAPQVQLLREIRDNKVLSTESGSLFMTGFNTFYYSFSPIIADWERQNPAFKETVKLVLTPLLASLSILNYVDIDSEQEMLGYGIGIILMNIGMYFVAPAIVIFRIKNR